ncbi:ribosomal protein L7/L12 [Brachybacterium aquaticum]|uniref:Ribosomal protein L7/L12 n=1 Tax=Brachybacterium aquaticum TaxID=1432564 RepID=A0A841AIA7_9MICO|nr:ribosomal protein L7/L12 [Brachybacterium aquaticum]MBB5833000.1 ribosomal protein L7/L12 [Brachybacterium aquaticum]
MFGRSAQQQKPIETLQKQVRDLEGLVAHLAERAGVGEAELFRLRGEIGQQIPERSRQLLAEGKKIEAIKVYREETGAGLKDAKDAVEAYEARG